MTEEMQQTEVTQDVSLGPKFFRYFRTAFDFMEKSGWRILKNIRQKVESASVGHCWRGGLYLVILKAGLIHWN